MPIRYDKHGYVDKSGTKWCEHCRGRGVCSCATCGKTIVIEEEGSKYGVVLKKEKQIEGICQICKGARKVRV